MSTLDNVLEYKYVNPQVVLIHFIYTSGMIAWSAITTGKGLGREEVTGLFAKSRFNRKYSTFSWCEEELAVPDVSVYHYYVSYLYHTLFPSGITSFF